jgi:arylformamidase
MPNNDDIPVVGRRALIAGAAAALTAPAIAQQPAAALTAPALAQQPAARHTKGPRVFLDYDQAELDAAYDQSVYAPNMQQIIARYASNSETMRARIGAPKRVAYGSSEVEKLDIYATRKANAPINVFIHGGAWRAGLAKDYAFPAEVFLAAGAHFVVPDFITVQDAGGSLLPMAEQVRRAIAWVYENAASFGGEPSRIYLSGHSSGAHLAGVALVSDWQKDFGVPANVVKGGVLCSGMYDLRGARLSARSNYVKFDDAMEDAMSTQRHLEKIATPLVLLYGTLETPEFQRQSREFAAALDKAGKPVKLIIAEGYNHFEIMETLGSPYGPFGHAALQQMQIG